MTIRPRGSAFQVDVAVNGRRFRKNCLTLDEAAELEATAIDCLTRGVEVSAQNAGTPSVRTLKQLYEETADRHWAGTRNEKNARNNARAILSVLGESTAPKSVGPMEIDRLVKAFREEGNAPATINRKLATLSKMLRFAEERGIIHRMPKVPRFREKQTRIRWYSKAEENTLLAHLAQSGQEDFRDLVIFLLDTGCRASEAGRARWRDIIDGQLHIWESKSDRHRAIPLTSRVTEMLGRRSRDGELIFPGWMDSTGTSTKMSKTFTELRRAIGLNDEAACLHACRHTFASRLVQMGVPLRTVQTLLGHSSINTTQRYAHLAPQNLLDAVAMLERVTD